MSTSIIERSVEVCALDAATLCERSRSAQRPTLSGWRCAPRVMRWS